MVEKMASHGKGKEGMHRLSTSVTIACGIFLVVLCCVLSLASCWVNITAMHGRYIKEMESVVTYVESHIDHDDMSHCADTYIESEKHKEVQAFLDRFIDYFNDVHYVYIIQVLPATERSRVVEICAANSTYEKEYEPEYVLHLGDSHEYWYDDEMEERLWQALQKEEDSYFTDYSSVGVDYTLARPLVDSSGKHYGLLCVDVSAEDVDRTIRRTILINVAAILVLGFVFSVLLLRWMRDNVTRPLKQLEESVSEYAEQSMGKRDPDQLVFNPPRLKVKNEVKSLSDSIMKVSVEVRGYVQEMLEAEDKNIGLQKQVFEDALTKAMNKAAYGERARRLAEEIDSRVAQFAIVMIDLNNLKQVNDTYGHERGDAYIIGTCDIISHVFAHSHVYRVGGDEFVVVLQGSDYDSRLSLVRTLRETFEKTQKDMEKEPWQRYSAAVGLAKYHWGDGLEDVYNRADQRMYKEKIAMKAGRK